MNYSVWFDTMNMGWSIVQIKGSQFLISKINMYFSQSILFLFYKNSENPDEMPHSVTFYLGLHCLPGVSGSLFTYWLFNDL